MVPRVVLWCSAVLAFAGCGDERDASPPANPPVTELEVTFDADGRGPEPAERRRVRCGSGRDDAACATVARLRPADINPKRYEGCTAQWDGPETARIAGQLEGSAVDGRFARTNGCEIARWEKVAPLLEATG